MDSSYLEVVQIVTELAARLIHTESGDVVDSLDDGARLIAAVPTALSHVSITGFDLLLC